MSNQAAVSSQGGASAHRVVLAVPHAGLSEGIQGLLATRFDAVVLVSDETSLAECLGALHPELLVLDLALARRAGMALAERLHTAHPEVRILLLVEDEDAGFTRAAKAAGADGCLLKRALGHELLSAADQVLVGGKAFWSSRQPEPGRPAGP